MNLLLVGIGGAFGSMARYAVTVLLRERLGTGFPYGTFAVNVIGSFLLGVIMTAGLKTEQQTFTMRLALGTGVMGGFTTYSTFNFDVVRYFQERAYGLLGLNVGLTVVVCFLGGLLGVAAGRWIGV